MKAKEKAKELVGKMFNKMSYFKYQYDSIELFEQSKIFAIIAVDEIIQASPNQPSKPLDIMPHFNSVLFWQEVKKEIELIN